MNRTIPVILALLAGACSSERPQATAASVSEVVDPATLFSVDDLSALNTPCPPGMVQVDSFCMDQYEAPNQRGEKPLVMQSAEDAEAWCSDRGLRLCTEDEWERACAGTEGRPYPYGTSYEPTYCNTDKKYVGLDEGLLNEWPKPISQREVDRIWQGEPSGNRSSCASPEGIYDLVGNVEEWVRRKQPVGPFRHILKGRFWAGGNWTCQQGVWNHADKMRYYETGFRCCSELRSER